MDRRILAAGAAALMAIAMSAQADPQKRGPQPKVVRPAAKEFPLRAKTEIKGEVDAPKVVDAAWSGPRLQSQADTTPQWMRAPQTAWDKLMEWRDAAFGDARAEPDKRR